MPLNLITDPWIPVVAKTGEHRVIAPWQMADPDIDRPAWPRADLDLACYELLIGLVHLADPPRDAEDWEDRQTPDPGRLREALAPLAEAFNLLKGETCFLQEKGGLEGEAGPADMLFIDSAGASTARKNADLMVRRGRYPALEQPLAAMALYALQQHAPSGGAGNRTSMRGGGPLVTLVDPGTGLWDLVWANVPYGAPQGASDLPWMHPPRTSQGKGLETYPSKSDAIPAEAFFGMPRRLRLVVEEGRITGAVQRPWGANYDGWVHPLTPYYRKKAGGELLPRHPKAGRFDYRQWPGVVLEAGNGELQQRALSLRAWQGRSHDGHTRLLVGGWAMNNMSPVDFVLASEPLLDMSPEAEIRLRGLIQAADIVRFSLSRALTPVLSEGSARDAVVEELYAATEATFLEQATALAAREPDFQAISKLWLRRLGSVALELFDNRAVPGIESASIDAKAVVKARSGLLATLTGYGKTGESLYGRLNLEAPPQRKKAKT